MRLLIFFVTLTGLILIKQYSYCQSIAKDLENGLYQLTPDFLRVYKLKSDTLKSFKLNQSSEHFDKISLILFDSIPKKNRPEFYNYTRKDNRIDNIIELDNNQIHIIYNQDTSFVVLSIERKGIGLDASYRIYPKKDGDLKNIIKNDTTKYFSYTMFTENDIRDLKLFKNIKDLDQNDYNSIVLFMDNNKYNFANQLNNTPKKSMYGTVEFYELWVKAFIAIKANPIVMPGEFSKFQSKYKADK